MGAEISAIGSGTQRKAVRADWQYQGQVTETITDKDEGENKKLKAEEVSALQRQW